MGEQLTIFDAPEQTTPIFSDGSYVLLAFNEQAADAMDIIYMYDYGADVLGKRGRVMKVLDHDVYEIYVESKDKTVYWYGRDLILI